jgi:hypothetical protein
LGEFESRLLEQKCGDDPVEELQHRGGETPLYALKRLRRSGLWAALRAALTPPRPCLVVRFTITVGFSPATPYELELSLGCETIQAIMKRTT